MLIHSVHQNSNVVALVRLSEVNETRPIKILPAYSSYNFMVARVRAYGHVYSYVTLCDGMPAMSNMRYTGWRAMRARGTGSLPKRYTRTTWLHKYVMYDDHDAIHVRDARVWIRALYLHLYACTLRTYIRGTYVSWLLSRAGRVAIASEYTPHIRRAYTHIDTQGGAFNFDIGHNFST